MDLAHRASRVAGNAPVAVLHQTRGAEAAAQVLAVTASGIAGFAWMAWLGWRKAEGLTSGAFDQAYFQQLVWSIGNGHGFQSSFNPGSFLGLHFSPLLVVPAVLELAWPDARVLTLLQAAALGAAVPAAYLLIRAALGHGRAAGWLAMALAAPMLIWPIMQQQIRADFHTESLALPMVLLAGWAGLTRRTGLMFAAALLALTAREDQVYPVAVIALLVAARAPGRLRGGPRRSGLALLGVAAAWGIAVFGVVMPYFRAGVAYDTDSYYAWLGGGLGALNAVVERTGEIVAALTRPTGWIAAAWLVAGLGGLGLLRPRWLVLVVPPLGAHLLSRQGPQQDVVGHYGLLLVVPAVVAAALGGRRLLALLARSDHSRSRRVATGGTREAAESPSAGVPPWRFATFALPAVIAALQAGAVPPFSDLERGFWERPAAIDKVRAVAAKAPHEAMLSVDWGVAPAVASRPALELLPFDYPNAYVLVDGQPFVTGTFQWLDRPGFLSSLEASGRPLLVDDGRFRLWGPAP